MNNKKISLPRTPAEWLEAVMNFIFFLCGILAVGCVLLISVYMVLSGVPDIQKIGLFRFLFVTRWASTAADPAYGILPFILSSVYGTLGATVIGVPIGLLTAVFLSKVASRRVASVVRPAVELLRANGLNICVGTDSLASNGALSLVDELRLLGDGVPLAERLLWATAGGAAALGFGDELGEIAPGRRPGVALLEGIDFSAMRLLPESRTTRLA